MQYKYTTITENKYTGNRDEPLISDAITFILREKIILGRKEICLSPYQKQDVTQYISKKQVENILIVILDASGE